VLCLYFLNVVRLAPGEALFLGPNDPHAYLSGDCLECMACSDNVVRAGLTPKFKDVPRLCGMLTYASGPGSERILHGAAPPAAAQPGAATVVYPVPVSDFCVAATTVAPGASAALAAEDGPSIFIVTAGTGSAGGIGGAGASLELVPGRIVFVAAGLHAALAAGADGLAVVRAYCVE
jgi:mannose-6-phosphate isomerase